MKKLFKSKLFLQVIVASLVATLATVGIVGAVTTIGTSISTGGQLTVSGTATSTLAGDTAFDTDTLYVDSINNRVGIGSTTPFATLSIDTNAGDRAFVIGSSTGTILTVDSSYDLSYKTNALYLDYSSGYVGLGSTTPFAALGVTNTGTQLDLAYNNAYYTTLNTDATGYFAITPIGLRTGIASTTPFGTLAINTSAGVNPFVIGSSTGTYLTVDTSGNLAVDTDTLKVDAANNKVGIGSTTPSSTFSVTTSEGVSPFAIGSSTGTYLIVNNRGRLGIGSSTPNSTFSVTTSEGVSPFAIGSSTGTYLKVDNRGRLGIGSSTPNATLSAGSGGATTTVMMARPCFAFETDNGTLVYYWPSLANGVLGGWATSTTSCF